MIATVEHPHWTSREAWIASPKRRDDLRVDEFEGEAVVVDPKDGSVHRLNETAMFVWKLSDGVITTRQIAQRLTESFDVDFEDALDCVDQLVVRFAELGLFAH